MNDKPKTLPEQLDAAKDGEEFGSVLSNFLAHRPDPDYTQCRDYCYEGDEEMDEQ